MDISQINLFIQLMLVSKRPNNKSPGKANLKEKLYFNRCYKQITIPTAIHAWTMQNDWLNIVMWLWLSNPCFISAQHSSAAGGTFKTYNQYFYNLLVFKKCFKLPCPSWTSLNATKAQSYKLTRHSDWLKSIEWPIGVLHFKRGIFFIRLDTKVDFNRL